MGTQRSGTTLLRLILDSHPAIAVGFETGFMRAVQTIKNIPDYAYGKDWYVRWGLTEADMNERIRSFYGGIFSDYARAQGKRRWGEKTPLNLWRMDEVSEIFPDAQFVCIVRHPAAVASSLMQWRYTFDGAVDYWRTANRIIRASAASLGAERALICRYEDLLLNPQEVLTTVMTFLDEPWSDDLLRHHEVQAAQASDMKVEGGTHVDRPLDPSRIAAWQDRIDEDQLHYIRHKAGGLLRHFGYKARLPLPVAPIATDWKPPA